MWTQQRAHVGTLDNSKKQSSSFQTKYSASKNIFLISIRKKEWHPVTYIRINSNAWKITQIAVTHCARAESTEPPEPPSAASG